MRQGRQCLDARPAEPRWHRRPSVRETGVHFSVRLTRTVSQRGQLYPHTSLGADISAELFFDAVSQVIIDVPTVYTTSNGTYMAFRSGGLICPAGSPSGADLMSIRSCLEPAIPLVEPFSPQAYHDPYHKPTIISTLSPPLKPALTAASASLGAYPTHSQSRACQVHPGEPTQLGRRLVRSPGRHRLAHVDDGGQQDGHRVGPRCRDVQPARSVRW